MDRRPAAVLLALLAFSGAAAAEPLAGRVWAPDEARFVEPDAVTRAVAGVRFVLLGEQHPIARHHVLQARLIRAAAQQRQPAVVFEMIPRSRQGDIDAWREAPEPAVAAFGPAVGWDERGWPDWRLYEPIARAALAQDLPLVAGAPARAQLRPVARSGLAGLEPGRRAALGLDRPLPADARDRLLATLRAAHCGEMHAPATRMLAVQRLRDASMSERLRTAAGDAGAILVAGHGHTRRDYGVPRYLNADEDDVVAIAFRATGGIGDRIADHVAAAGGELPYDYVWFTEGQVSARPCDP